MAIARAVTIDLGGRRIEQRLTQTAQRRLVENLGLIAAEAEGVDHIEKL